MKTKSQWQKDRDEENRGRATRVDSALRGYRLAKEERDSDESNLRDLLTDCMHWAKREGVNFFEELETAKMNYNAEI